jgi:hypothetical protein
MIAANVNKVSKGVTSYLCLASYTLHDMNMLYTGSSSVRRNSEFTAFGREKFTSEEEIYNSCKYCAKTLPSHRYVALISASYIGHYNERNMR